MQAAIISGKNTIKLKEKPIPKIGPNDVLMKVRSVGICGTDLHMYSGGTASNTNTVIGHEFSGEIVDVGSHVTNIQIGDRAVAEHVITCHTCFYCLRGRPNLCLKSKVIGIDAPGALAEFIALPSELVYRFPNSISFDEAALIEPLTIALYAASQAGFLVEKRVAVVGQGPIGILLDQVLQSGGAHVIGIDVLPERLNFAKKQGWVHETLNPKDTAFSLRLKEMSNVGVDASFEAVGRETTVKLCIDITRRDGDIFLLGIFEKPARLDLMRVIKKELNIYGSWTCAFSFPHAIDMVAEKKILLKPLITHIYKFTDVAKAFSDAASYSNKRIKTIIRVS